MRSVLARIIVVAAIITVIPSALDFLAMTRNAFSFNEWSVEGGAWLILGRALAAPLGLFVGAAMVEMLYRISEALPRVAPVASAPTRGRLWPWRSPIANLLLLVAAIAYAIPFWAMLQYWLHGAPSVMTPESPQASLMTGIGMVQYWLTSPVVIIAWAAVVEYLSRIAAAFRPASSAP